MTSIPTSFDSLKEEWDAIQAEAPSELAGVPSREEVDRLRAHKARVKSFLAPLSAEDRAAFSGRKVKREAKKAKRDRKRDGRAKLKEFSPPAENLQNHSGESETPALSSSPCCCRPIRLNDVAEALGAKLGAEPRYLTKDGSSWYILARRWMETPDEETFDAQWALHPTSFHELELFGRTVSEKRWSQSWGHSYAYSGSVNRARELREDDDDSKMVRDLIDRVNEIVSGVDLIPGDSDDDDDGLYNGCLQNWYETDQQIGFHSDDEKSLRAGCPIFSLTWGGTRRFVFRARADSPSPCVDKVREVYLKDGDLLVMGGTCQRTHKHSVPKPRATMDPPTSNRINWTIRAFAT